jgi:hypothetical protein
VAVLALNKALISTDAQAAQVAVVLAMEQVLPER